MKKIFYAIVAAAALFGVACDKTSEIKVMSYNIRMSGNPEADGPNYWDFRKEASLNLIHDENPTVFGLQEACPDQMEYMTANLPEYGFIGVGRDDGISKGEHMTIFWKKDEVEMLDGGTFWLSETPDTPGLKGWGAACPRVCSYLILRDRTSGKKFCFANTHTDHISALAREKGMLLVIERMKKFGAGVPIVFTGDHNCRETEAPAKAVAAILKDALYESETVPKGSWRTFSGWKWLERELPIPEALEAPIAMRNAKKGSPDGIKDASGVHPWEKYGARIDYIYVSPGVKVLDFETVNAPRPGKKLYPSDHFPVVASVEL
jgi:endonuclease/exonuclease/phosphatase family metal-dependent hydrolase